jgi:hypothetical protein
MSKRNSLEGDGTCVDGKCPTSASGDVDSVNSLRTISTVGFAVGVVGLGAGVALLLAAPPSSESEKAAVRPWVGLGAAGMAGRF